MLLAFPKSTLLGVVVAMLRGKCTLAVGGNWAALLQCMSRLEGTWGACQLYSGHFTMFQGGQRPICRESFSSNCALTVDRDIELFPSWNRGPPLALFPTTESSQPLTNGNTPLLLLTACHIWIQAHSLLFITPERFKYAKGIWAVQHIYCHILLWDICPMTGRGDSWGITFQCK